MESKQQIRYLTPTERKFATDNYHLINKFLRRSRLDAEEFFDIVVMDYLLSVQAYLNNVGLRKKYCFEAICNMYLKRAIYRHFRQQKALKRCSEAGKDISFEEQAPYIIKAVCNMNNCSSLEYTETIKQIESILTAEQQRIFFDRLEGYSLKEIAENIGVKPKRVYNQFGKIKSIVAEIMEIQQFYR